MRMLLADTAGIELAGEARLGHDAVSLVVDLRPDVAVVDCSMPDLHWVEVVRQINDTGSGCAVVVLDTYGEHAEAVRSVGATHLLKGAPTEQLVEAIRRSAAARELK